MKAFRYCWFVVVGVAFTGCTTQYVPQSEPTVHRSIAKQVKEDANPLISEPARVDLLKRQDTESMAEIKSAGVGDRLVIKEIQAKTGSGSGTVTVLQYRSGLKAIAGAYFGGDAAWVHPVPGLTGQGKISGFPTTPSQALTPDLAFGEGRAKYFATRHDGYLAADGKGKMIFDGTGRVLDGAAALDAFLPMSDGSIHRFIGKHTCFGLQISSQEDDPLTFAVVKDVGYVYLHGTGLVTLKDGREVTLGK